MKGLGMSAVLPAGVMLLGKIYRPGPRKNLIFALYGSFAPIGFFCGIFIGGLSSQYLSWRWYFWIASIIMAILMVISLLSIPNDYNNNREIHMDWWGTATIVPGLSLVTYALTDSAQAPNGWKSPQILVTFLLGLLCLAAGYYVENHVASSPLLPADLFAPRYMKRLVLALWLTYGAFGLYLFYSSFYIELVLQKSPIVTAIWYISMIVGGLLLGIVGGFTLHLLPGRALLVISGCGNLLCVLLFAVLPEKPNYWAYIFPAMVCATIGIDISFTVSNVFITTALPEHYQGLAGAFINSLLFLGVSFCLGVSDIVVHQTTDLGLKHSYQMAFWLAVGAAGLALLLYCTIKIGSAKSDLTVQEKRQMDETNAEGLQQRPDSVQSR
ncbi:major facilitator superfamily transporter [Colletotrichum musicola]|uniref:Major facilitator superfamily transporter n=1 Tax=Colletotrichum musicola TaxID=2175873 RepID=A0A8H6IQQ7_9PEZI|nr:major facilitator superfamily transporter [Colletotrichum musicola]